MVGGRRSLQSLTRTSSGLTRKFPSWSEEKAEEIIRLVHIGTPLVSAAASAGLNRKTFERWRKRIPIFEESIQVARDAAVTAKVAIVSAAAQGRELAVHKCPEKGCPGKIEVQGVKSVWQAAAWWLERTHHVEFGRKDILESKIEVRVKVELVRFAQMVVTVLNEEVGSIDDRERARDRLLERLGIPGLETGHPGDGYPIEVSALPDAPVQAPPGPEGAPEASSTP